MRVIKLGLAAIFAVFVISFVNAVRSARESVQEPAGAPVIEQATVTPSVLDVGTVGTLTLGSSDALVVVARDYEAFREFHKLAAAQDWTGCEGLRLSGRIELVGQGTRARVLELHFTCYRVRIEDGQYAGMDGFIAREHIH